MTCHHAIVLLGGSLIQDITIQLHTGNKRLIEKNTQRTTHPRTINQHSESDVDLKLQLLSEINTMKSLVHNLSIHHMTSYGVKTKKKDLTSIEYLHCIADGLAKQARLMPRQCTYHHFPCNQVTMTLNQQMLMASYTSRTAKAYQSINVRQYLRIKNGWSSNTIDTIWWRIHHQALKKISESEQMTLRKLNNDCWATSNRGTNFMLANQPIVPNVTRRWKLRTMY
jgi:hypothetical protein